MQSDNRIWPVYAILQNDFFIKNFYEKYGLETSFQGFFNFQKILCKKDSVSVSKLIWTNFDRFAITYVI